MTSGSSGCVEKLMNTPIKREQANGEEDDLPPQLQIEQSADEFIDGDNVVHCQLPERGAQYVTISKREDGVEVYLDEDGEEVQMLGEVHDELRTVEFNFLDNQKVGCGLCGEIVPYEYLLSQHLPQDHPEVFEEGPGVTLHSYSYDSWQKERLEAGRRRGRNRFATNSDIGPIAPLRKVSQVRVNPMEMDVDELERALHKKMIEKMGRKVPVSLVDKQHARCGLCSAIISLNRKFEVVHVVRHFNAWHSSAHRCTGLWQRRDTRPGYGKPLSIHDFAVLNLNIDAVEHLQCIWCGVFMSRNDIAEHFTEIHSDEVEVPKCQLCLQEMIINARLLEKYGDDYAVSLPDEHNFKCPRFPSTFRSEAALDKAIARRVQKINAAANNESAPVEEEDDEDEGEEGQKQQAITNSRMAFGRRNKPKRSFVQPSLRQAVPVNSKYVESVTECQWRCKLCKGLIFGAVISAGAIKHYKEFHPGEMENMQYELCKARLDRVSGGCMAFVHPQLVECLICNMTYALHKPYNICRGVRHLKLKHPHVMPEYIGTDMKDTVSASVAYDNVQMGELIEDKEMIARFKNEYEIDFDKVQPVYTRGGAEPVYVLLKKDETLNRRTASQIIESLGEVRSEFTTQGIEEESLGTNEDIDGEVQYAAEELIARNEVPRNDPVRS